MAHPETGTLPAPADTVSSIAFDRRGSRVLAASWDGSVHVYSTSLTRGFNLLRSYQPAGQARESLLDVAFHEVSACEHWVRLLVAC